MTASAEKMRDVGELRAEIEVGTVAAGSDYGVRSLAFFKIFDCQFRFNLAQQRDDILHKHRILARILHARDISARDDAHQIEKSDERNIARHDYRDPPGLMRSERVAG